MQVHQWLAYYANDYRGGVYRSCAANCEQWTVQWVCNINNVGVPLITCLLCESTACWRLVHRATSTIVLRQQQRFGQRDGMNKIYCVRRDIERRMRTASWIRHWIPGDHRQCNHHTVLSSISRIVFIKWLSTQALYISRVFVCLCVWEREWKTALHSFDLSCCVVFYSLRLGSVLTNSMNQIGTEVDDQHITAVDSQSPRIRCQHNIIRNWDAHQTDTPSFIFINIKFIFLIYLFLHRTSPSLLLHREMATLQCVQVCKRMKFMLK